MAITNPVVLPALHQGPLSVILFFVYYQTSATGMVILSPMMVAPVCHVGDPLQLTCTASVEFIRWSILQVNEQGTLDQVINDVAINSRDVIQMLQALVNSDILTFTRSSAQGAIPLISTLSIDSVGIGLNGTVVRCTDVANPVTSGSTTIYITDTSQYIQYTPTLSIVSEEYEADNVTLTVEWIPAQQALATYQYSLRISPSVPIMFTGSSSLRLTVSYSTEYNLSIVATAPCRPNATAFIILNHANCGFPDLLPMCKAIDNDSIPNIEGYDDVIPVEGSTIRFSCPPGLVLIGSNSATCTENGEWEPDPRQFICTEKTNESRCTCPVLAGVVSSTVIVFLVISIITFITGFLCGHYIKFQSPKQTHIITDHSHQAPEYEDIDVTCSMKHKEQGLELKENVAYGPSKQIHDS